VSITTAGELVILAEREVAEKCAEKAREVARAASKGTYGRISLEELGDKIADEIIALGG
jgi:hypothetical protein